MRGITRWGIATFAVVALMMALSEHGAAGQTGPCLPNCGKVQQQVYTAEVKSTNVQTLADGTTITREGKQVYARDSLGRTMQAMTGYPFVGDRSGFTRVNANDPVENTQSNWDSQTKKARVIKMPPQDERHGCWSSESGNFRMNFGPVPGSSQTKSGAGTAASSPVATLPPVPTPRPKPKSQTTEDLGTTMIMGVEAHGTRTTITTPVGEMGNDRPLVRTVEHWSAPGFGFPMRQVNIDPQSGRQTTELVSLDLGEPDPATFQPPEGYAVAVEVMHEVACETMQP